MSCACRLGLYVQRPGQALRLNWDAKLQSGRCGGGKALIRGRGIGRTTMREATTVWTARRRRKLRLPALAPRRIIGGCIVPPEDIDELDEVTIRPRLASSAIGPMRSGYRAFSSTSGGIVRLRVGCAEQNEGR